MDNPDLSHLLDDASSGGPSREVLDSIVRRHRRIQARRARTAATLGLVIAIAGAGLGIGLSHKAGTATATNTPNLSTSLPTAQPKGRSASAPSGLGWVDAGSVGGSSHNGSSAAEASPTYSSNPAGTVTGSLKPTTSASSAGTGLCSLWSCSRYWANGLPGGSALRPLLTRTSDGVTVRAFAASWAAAPLELVPVTVSSGGPSLRSGGTPPPAGNSAVGSAGAGHGSTTTTAPSPPDAGTTTTQLSSTIPEPVVAPGCALTQALVVEVSDAGAVGIVIVPLGPSVQRPINVLSYQLVGVAERSPIEVVVAHSSPQSAAVLAEFSGGGRDEMTVVGGWAVLVHQVRAAAVAAGGGGVANPSGRVKVLVLSAGGKVLEQAALPRSDALAMAVDACLVPLSGVHKQPVSPTGGTLRKTVPGSSVTPKSSKSPTTAQNNGG